MRLGDQWRRIEAELPENWATAQLALKVEDTDELTANRAAAMLGPLTPGRRGDTIRIFCARDGTAPGPEAVRRALARLDIDGIRGTLELVDAKEAEGDAVERSVERPTLAAAWDAAVGALPPDWSDLYVEVELRSTDHLERAALMLSPTNPARADERPAFRFRVARRFGYGASPAMARRALARCDEENIRGSLQILRVLSDTNPVQTQGPVWYVGGRAV